ARGIFVWVGVGLIDVREVSPAPGQIGIFGGIASMLPRPAFAEETGLFKFFQTRAMFGIHSSLLARQCVINLFGTGEGAAKNQMREVALIFERVGLGQHASVGVAEQAYLAEAECLAYGLDVFHHVFHGVLLGVFEFFGAPGAALINKDDQ